MVHPPRHRSYRLRRARKVSGHANVDRSGVNDGSDSPWPWLTSSGRPVDDVVIHLRRVRPHLRTNQTTSAIIAKTTRMVHNMSRSLSWRLVVAVVVVRLLRRTPNACEGRQSNRPRQMQREEPDTQPDKADITQLHRQRVQEEAYGRDQCKHGYSSSTRMMRTSSHSRSELKSSSTSTHSTIRTHSPYMDLWILAPTQSRMPAAPAMAPTTRPATTPKINIATRSPASASAPSELQPLPSWQRPHRHLPESCTRTTCWRLEAHQQE